MRKAQVRKTLHRSYKLFKRFGFGFGFGFDDGGRGERRGPSFRDMLEEYREEQYWLALDEQHEERLIHLEEYEHELAWRAWSDSIDDDIHEPYGMDAYDVLSYEDDWDGYDYDDYDSHVIQDTTFRCKRHQDCLANPQLAEACVAERIAGLQRKKAS